MAEEQYPELRKALGEIVGKDNVLEISDESVKLQGKCSHGSGASKVTITFRWDLMKYMDIDHDGLKALLKMPSAFVLAVQQAATKVENYHRERDKKDWTKSNARFYDLCVSLKIIPAGKIAEHSKLLGCTEQGFHKALHK